MDLIKQTVSLKSAIGAGFFVARALAILLCLVMLPILITIAVNGSSLSIELDGSAMLCLWLFCAAFAVLLLWAIADIIFAINGKIWVFKDTLLETQEHLERSAVSVGGMNTSVSFSFRFEKLYQDFGYMPNGPITAYSKAEENKEYYLIFFRGELKNILDVEKYELSPALMSRFVPDTITLGQRLNWNLKKPEQTTPYAN